MLYPLPSQNRICTFKVLDGGGEDPDEGSREKGMGLINLVWMSFKGEGYLTPPIPSLSFFFFFFFFFTFFYFNDSIIRGGRI